MYQENFKKSPEKQNKGPANPSVERRLLGQETLGGVQTKFNGYLVEAKRLFHPQHWYLADIITRFIREQRAVLAASQKDKGGILVETDQVADNLFKGFKYLIKNRTAPALRTALFDVLAVNESTRETLPITQPNNLVEAAMSGGESSPERLGLLSIYVLVNESHSRDISTPHQRTYERFLKTMDIKIFESLLNDLTKTHA